MRIRSEPTVSVQTAGGLLIGPPRIELLTTTTLWLVLSITDSMGHHTRPKGPGAESESASRKDRGLEAANPPTCIGGGGMMSGTLRDGPWAALPGFVDFQVHSWRISACTARILEVKLIQRWTVIVRLQMSTLQS